MDYLRRLRSRLRRRAPRPSPVAPVKDRGWRCPWCGHPLNSDDHSFMHVTDEDGWRYRCVCCGTYSAFHD